MNQQATTSEDATAAAALLEFLERPEYRPLTQRDLMHRMNVPPERRPVVRDLIGRLLEEGRLIRVSRGKLAAAPRRETVRGLLQRHRDGFGFVAPDEGGEDVFVPARHLADAISGDRVLVRLVRVGRGTRQEGMLLRILERRPRMLLGVYRLQGRRGTVQAFDPSLGTPFPVRASFAQGATDEQVVEFELLRGAGGEGAPEGRVLEVLGDLDEPGTDIQVVAREHGLRTELPPAVVQAAEALPSRISPKQKQHRTRFDDPPPVTIDGETAQDFDDAIAVEELPGGGFRLFVHIADVSHFVEPDGLVDGEAQRRGTSVYFPGRVLPMLPEKLSNDLCSLRPGVDRLVQTAILDIDDTGEVRKTRFADGVIRSAARLTYTQVSGALEGENDHGVPARLLPMLRTADRLRQVLSEKRRARGSVDLDLPEPQILLDVEGALTGITLEPRNVAHLLIEEFMLAANEAVAGWLERRGAPCMYRIHDTPDPFKLETLAQFAATLGHALPGNVQAIDSSAILHLLESAEGRPEYAVISQLTLRSMKQARYSMSNIGHFGLAAPVYCHFTSPIRRYPDLIVHRLLRARREGTAPQDVSALDAVAKTCTEQEKNAEAAERTVLAWKKVAFIAGCVGQEFAGVVTGVTRFGLFVQLTDNLVEGLVRIDRLGADRFEFSEQRQELRGEQSGKRFRLGDRLQVRVARVDRVLRRVDFEPVEATPPAQAPAPKRGRPPAARRAAQRRKSTGARKRQPRRKS